MLLQMVALIKEWIFKIIIITSVFGTKTTVKSSIYEPLYDKVFYFINVYEEMFCWRSIYDSLIFRVNFAGGASLLHIFIHIFLAGAFD